MKQTKYEPKALMTARFKAEAQQVLSKRSGRARLAHQKQKSRPEGGFF